MKPESHTQILSEGKQEQGIQKLETGKVVFDFLERTKFLHIRRSDESFDEFLQEISYEDFKHFITRLNGILREVKIKSRSIDGQGVEVSFGIMNDVEYLPPASDQKDSLMRKCFEGLKEIIDNEDRALLVHYALQAIHPYADGNGRTGRLLHELISSNGTEITAESLSALLDHDKAGNAGTGIGREAFEKKVLDPASAYYYINREVAKEILGEEYVNEYGIIYVAAPVGVGFLSEETKRALSSEESTLAIKILAEGGVKHFSFRGLVLSKLVDEKVHLQKHKYLSDNVINEKRVVVHDDLGKKFDSIEGEALMLDLTPDDVHRLIEIHSEVKKKFVECMIDVFVNPDKHIVKNKEGEGVAIKDLFRK